MSMVTSGYIQMMARYNTWQNKHLREILPEMPELELTKDRGAFFGSIFATVNHLMWGDQLWMSRFDGGDGPACDPKDHKALTANINDWATERFRTDGRIRVWADRVQEIDLTGDLTWYSGFAKREITKPLGLCIAHFFNHQTHHRGQVHAMLTAAGQKTIDSDIPFMPEEM